MINYKTKPERNKEPFRVSVLFWTRDFFKVSLTDLVKNKIKLMKYYNLTSKEIDDLPYYEYDFIICLYT